MNPLEATRVSQTSLPVIDIGGLTSNKLADREAVGARLRAACLDNGFFYICNHGVSESSVAEVFAEPTTSPDANNDPTSPWTSLANLTRRDAATVRAVGEYFKLITNQVVAGKNQVKAVGDFGNNKGIRRIWQALQLLQLVALAAKLRSISGHLDFHFTHLDHERVLVILELLALALELLAQGHELILMLRPHGRPVRQVLDFLV